MAYFYLALTVAFSVYGQFVLKWRINLITTKFGADIGKVDLILKAVTDVFVLSGFLSAVVAAITWMLAMAKLQLTLAYPLTVACTFISISIISIMVLEEKLTIVRAIGIATILLGIFLIVKQ